MTAEGNARDMLGACCRSSFTRIVWALMLRAHSDKEVSAKNRVSTEMLGG